MIFLDKEYLEVKATKNKGKGIFAKKIISAGMIIGDYIGKVLKTRDIDLKKMGEDLYLMYYHDEASIYPDLEKDGIHLINHSCVPNCWIYILHGHTLLFALRDIKPNEELTISYLLAPKSDLCNPCPHVCMCGSQNCNKTFHLSESRFKKWREFQKAREKKDKQSLPFRGKKAKIKYGSELKLLPSYPKTIPNDYIKTVLLDFFC